MKYILITYITYILLCSVCKAQTPTITPLVYENASHNKVTLPYHWFIWTIYSWSGPVECQDKYVHIEDDDKDESPKTSEENKDQCIELLRGPEIQTDIDSFI